VKKAFTFIEMILVVAILAVLVALGVPRFQGTYQDLQLTNAARGLAKLLTYAEERAVIDEKKYRLQVNLAQRQYWLTVASEEGENQYDRLSGRYGRTVQFPETISFSVDKEEIFFYPDGSSDPFLITLKNSEGRELLLRDGKPFGYVRVEEKRPPS